MQELHCSTVEKIEYLRRQGYNAVEIWECDVNRRSDDEDMKHYFDHYHIAEPLEPRHALYGGRTNAAKLYHCCQGNEQIRYVDFTSLYPHVNRSKTVPTSHPEITENYRKFRVGRFQLFRVDQMHGITTSRFIPSRASTSPSRQIDVCLLQKVRRYRQSNSVHAFILMPNKPFNERGAAPNR